MNYREWKGMERTGRARKGKERGKGWSQLKSRGRHQGYTQPRTRRAVVIEPRDSTVDLEGRDDKEAARERVLQGDLVNLWGRGSETATGSEERG